MKNIFDSGENFGGAIKTFELDSQKTGDQPYNKDTANYVEKENMANRSTSEQMQKQKLGVGGFGL